METSKCLLKKTPQSTFGESSTKPCGATFPHPTAGYYLKCSSLWKTRFSISTLVIGGPNTVASVEI